MVSSVLLGLIPHDRGSGNSFLKTLICLFILGYNEMFGLGVYFGPPKKRSDTKNIPTSEANHS